MQLTRKEIRLYSSISEKDITNIVKFINLFYDSKLNFQFSFEKFQNFIEKYNVRDFSFIGSGEYSNVFKYENFAVKVYKMPGHPFNNDENILSKVQELKTFPILYMGCDYFVITEFIEGTILMGCTNKDFDVCNKKTLDIFFDDFKKVISSDIEPHDVHDGNIILSNEGVLRIIDVGLFKLKKIEGLENILVTFLDKEEIDEWILEEFIHISVCRAINSIQNKLTMRKLTRKIA